MKGLEWNPENPEEVRPNVYTEEGVPDYALIKDGRTTLIVEAKKLSQDIEQREVISQLAKYCFNQGTKYGVLTNGAVWILIKSFKEDTTLPERILWKVNLENDQQQAVLKKIGTISKTNIDHIEVLVEKVKILDEIWQFFLDKREEIIGCFIDGLKPRVDSIIRQSYPTYQFEDTEIKDFFKSALYGQAAIAETVCYCRG